MFEAFQRNFTPDPKRALERAATFPDLGIPDLNDLVVRFGGTSFNRGLYRVIRASDLDEWNARVLLGFPEFANRITCFGYDWLGRAFAADGQRLEQGQPGILMFEPGAGTALDVPANVQTFHDGALLELGETALAIDAHKEWLARGGAEPAYTQCIGFKVPLFLNGIDSPENLELSDIDVYWHLMGQLIAKTRNLPPGTRIGQVTIDD
jgi:hypothetical protein